MNKYILFKDLFKDYKTFKDLLIKNGIDEKDIIEDWFNYIFINNRYRLSIFTEYQQVYIIIILQYKKLISKWKLLNNLQQNIKILDLFDNTRNDTNISYSTNDVGADKVDYQVIGKVENTTTIKENINASFEKVYKVLDLLSDNTLNLLNQFIRTISNTLQ